MQRMNTWARTVLVGFAMVGISRAASVYKCVDGKGAITFQQIACTAGATGQKVKLRAEPPVPPSGLPPGTIVTRDSSSVASRGAEPPSLPPRNPPSVDPFYPSGADAGRARGFECRTAAGVTFYRVDECPRNLEVGSMPTYSARGEFSGSVPINMPVKSREISNAEACNKMGRQPMRYDTVSSYDKRNGKDPCR